MFPFRKLAPLMAMLALLIQVIIISYNHFNGYYTLDGTLDFAVRLIYSSVFTFLGGLLLAYPDLFLIHYLNRRYPWKTKLFVRVGLETLFVVLFGVIISVIITLVAHGINAYSDNLISVLWVNALITAVINLLLATALEGIVFFGESEDARLREAQLRQELGQLKYEVLKNQINPHFMFNSLNVLSGLIDSDPKQAQKFVDEFSRVYRYVLETIEKPVVTVGEELDFIRSYMFLQKIRYGGNLKYSIEVSAEASQDYLPPLSLQLVLENAIKHNVINNAHPLLIEIFSDEENLVIRNNVKAKFSAVKSTGIGQKNLIKRYAMIWHMKPEFKVETGHYLVKLPLIKAEE